MKLAELAQQHELKLESVRLFGRADSDPNWKAHHYQCRLSQNGNPGAFLFEYSKGTGLTRKAKPYERRGGVATVPEEPQLVETLDCLHSDLCGVCSGPGLVLPFREWADDLGMDPDSRRGYRTYKTILRQRRQLKTFLTPAAFAQFLECEGSKQHGSDSKRKRIATARRGNYVSLG